jgi:hypothetical protein
MFNNRIIFWLFEGVCLAVDWFWWLMQLENIMQLAAKLAVTLSGFEA